MSQEAARGRWFVKMELDLVTGRTIHIQLTRDEAVEFSKRMFVQERSDDDLALTRAAFSTLIYRIESQEGELVLPDADGKVWILPARSVSAVGFEHRVESEGKHPVLELGFRKPGEDRPEAER
jgi:hypothetical protein